MQMIPAISITNGLPTILVPLLFVILVSMGKDFWEDLKRKFADSEENNSKIKKWDNVTNTWITVTWKTLITGDFIKVENEHPIPADLLILFTSSPKKDCYVMTKNLDGETNLKPREVPIKLKQFINTEEEATSMANGGRFSIEAPNANIDGFAGSLSLNKEEISLN